jgi:hypothetical protein
MTNKNYVEEFGDSDEENDQNLTSSGAHSEESGEGRRGLELISPASYDPHFHS